MELTEQNEWLNEELAALRERVGVSIQVHLTYFLRSSYDKLLSFDGSELLSLSAADGDW